MCALIACVLSGFSNWALNGGGAGFNLARSLFLKAADGLGAF